MITAGIIFKDVNKVALDVPVSGDIVEAVECLLQKHNKNNEVAMIGVHDDSRPRTRTLIARYISDILAQFILNNVGIENEVGIHLF